jgi:hypothetical protein
MKKEKSLDTWRTPRRKIISFFPLRSQKWPKVDTSRSQGSGRKTIGENNAIIIIFDSRRPHLYVDPPGLNAEGEEEDESALADPERNFFLPARDCGEKKKKKGVTCPVEIKFRE